MNIKHLVDMQAACERNEVRGNTFMDMCIEMAELRDQVAAVMTQKVRKDLCGVALKKMDGTAICLSPSAKVEGQWQVTFFVNMQPISDAGTQSLDVAVQEFVDNTNFALCDSSNLNQFCEQFGLTT